MKTPTNEEIAKWFLDNTIWSKIQTPDGFDYAKDDGDYIYVWVMAGVDLDLEKHYLLDVRVSGDDWETRHFLYIHVDMWHNQLIRMESVGGPIKFNAPTEEHQTRLRSGLIKFSNLVANNHFRERKS